MAECIRYATHLCPHKSNMKGFPSGNNYSCFATNALIQGRDDSEGHTITVFFFVIFLALP